LALLRALLDGTAWVDLAVGWGGEVNGAGVILGGTAGTDRCSGTSAQGPAPIEIIDRSFYC